MNFIFECTNEYESEAIQKTAFEYGYSWSGSKEISYTHKKYLYFNVDRVIRYNNEITESWPILNFVEAVEQFEKNKMHTLKIGEYTVFIRKDSIVFGCTQIPKNKVEEIIKLWRDANA